MYSNICQWISPPAIGSYFYPLPLPVGGVGGGGMALPLCDLPVIVSAVFATGKAQILHSITVAAIWVAYCMAPSTGIQHQQHGQCRKGMSVPCLRGRPSSFYRGPVITLFSVRQRWTGWRKNTRQHLRWSRWHTVGEVVCTCHL